MNKDATQVRGKKVRFNIVLRERVNDRPVREVVLNRVPLRPGTLHEELETSILQQIEHHTYHMKKPYRGMGFWDDDGNLIGAIGWYRTPTSKHIFSIGVRAL